MQRKITWFVAVVLERFERHGECRSNGRRKCTAYSNTVLIKAKSPQEAYKKAVLWGRNNLGSECVDELGRKGKWIFEGIMDLLPIYEPIADGCEIMFRVHHGAVKRIKELVHTKREILSNLE